MKVTFSKSGDHYTVKGDGKKRGMIYRRVYGKSKAGGMGTRRKGFWELNLASPTKAIIPSYKLSQAKYFATQILNGATYYWYQNGARRKVN